MRRGNSLKKRKRPSTPEKVTVRSRKKENVKRATLQFEKNGGRKKDGNSTSRCVAELTFEEKDGRRYRFKEEKNLRGLPLG